MKNVPTYNYVGTLTMKIPDGESVPQWLGTLPAEYASVGKAIGIWARNQLKIPISDYLAKTLVDVDVRLGEWSEMKPFVETYLQQVYHGKGT